jgi:hypothetical protein
VSFPHWQLGLGLGLEASLELGWLRLHGLLVVVLVVLLLRAVHCPRTILVTNVDHFHRASGRCRLRLVHLRLHLCLREQRHLSESRLWQVGGGEGAWSSEVRVYEHTVQRRPQRRPALQDSPDQLLGVLAHRCMVWKRVLVVANPFVGGFDVFGLEGRLADQ